ncbi:DUF3419 domain-containing protein [Streptomyces sp. ICBB 8177]|uniref:DUF3419 domain-containing protein n=1 Tax=Streptomyces sp. ICBB 8177 TaxID=563922 RepID=UPI000D675D27|nr:DUF3419 domain-containing protein [Streptomyces sp. ICBB 8177]PWI42620.1 hypothetical protein CK485_09850 [Streptomyces sp. ICBB 8177]
MNEGTPWSHGRILTGQSGCARLLFGRTYQDLGVEPAAFRAAPEVTAVDVDPRQLDYARARVVDGMPACSGTAERLTAVGRHTAATLLPGWQPTAVRAFLRLDDPARQLRWWHEHLDGVGPRLLMASALRSAGPLAVLLRPGFRVVPPRFDAVLRARAARVVASYPNVAGCGRGRTRGASGRLRGAAKRAGGPRERPAGPEGRRERACRDGDSRRGTSAPPLERCPLWGTVRALNTGGNP